MMDEKVFGVETVKQAIIRIVLYAISAVALFAIVIAAIVLTCMVAL